MFRFTVVSALAHNPTVPDRDEGFAFQALFKFTQQFLGMCDHPSVNVGIVVRFAFLEIDIKLSFQF